MSKVKIIDRRSEKSIKGEREFLSKLRHPFIVNMNCAFQDYENLYLVMDLLTGGDLRYHICRIRKFTEEETKFFISCLLLGLEYIHNNNIIHRDIKPENLVSDENGYIRITDFGVAKINKEDNSSETSGTPGYMAPEVLMGINHSFSVDFFAIGIMGYEFMFGVRPYNGKNRKEIKQMVLKKQAKIDKSETDWSKESIDFINKCLKRKASKRLGYINGIIELKNHKWFEGYDWEKLYNKSILAPFIPKKEGNYDKKYCEMIEKCGDETLERYNNYLNKKNFTNLFLGYTYINLDLLQNNLNNETHTRFTTNSKQNKITISNNSNKKDIIKNNTNLINDNNNKKVNNKFNINNFNNINKKLNPPPLQMINYFSGFKKKENKPIKPEIVSPVYKEEIEKNENNEIEKEIKEINNDKKININSKIDEIKENINKRKNLVNSSSIHKLINIPSNRRKLKLDKNNSFLNLKGEINRFSKNNNNHNDTNLSSLLSSNSIINLNYAPKKNSFNKIQNNNNAKSPSNEHSISNANPQNKSYYGQHQTNLNKTLYAKSKKSINQLNYNFSCLNLIGSNSGRNNAFSGRNNSNLKIRFKVDNSYRSNSSLLSPRSKNDDNSKNKNPYNFNSNREFNHIKNKNYIQLRQTNLQNKKHLLNFYLPNLNKINNKKILNNLNYDEMKKKGKINLGNLYNILKNKNQFKTKEKYYLINKKKTPDEKIKRSGSTLLFNSGMNLKPKINNYINKNHGNIIREKKSTTNIPNNKNFTFRERKLKRNTSNLF